MYRYLRKLTLVKQIEEACELHRRVRRAEHRAALRLMRTSVTTRIKSELHKAQLEKTRIALERARAYARLKALLEILALQEKRKQTVENILSQHDLKLQDLHLEHSEEKVDDEQFKKQMLQSVQQYIPTDSTTNTANIITQTALQDSFDRVQLKGTHSKADMGVGLAVGIAKELGLSKSELEDLVAHVEKDGGDMGLRKALMDEMSHEEKHQ